MLAALHLLASGAPAVGQLVLFERTGKLGGGQAFATSHESHVLNVPASSMSALPGDPGHFVRWLEGRGRREASDKFVPRQLYRQYLRDTLWAHARSTLGEDGLEVREDDVVDVVPTATGGLVVPARGEPVEAEAIVLALGILPPRFPDGLVPEEAESRCVTNPWPDSAVAGIDPAATVTFMGTGLTAIDVLLALEENGHKGPVHAVSRHGLLPRVHFPHPDHERDLADLSRMVGHPSARALLGQVRRVVAEAEVRGGDWQEAIDLLRPRAQELWMGMPAPEQSRFKRHLERFWSVHRHRMAPQVGERVERLREAGLFSVHRGRLVAVEPGVSSLGVVVRTAKSGPVHRWSTDWLVNCSGPDPNVFRGDQVLLNRLRARGLAGPGPFGMGVGTSLSGEVLGASGRPVGWLWALGSLRQGQLLESTAVPEIRCQAQHLALDIAERLSTRDQGEEVLEREPVALRLMLQAVAGCADGLTVAARRATITTPRMATRPPSACQVSRD